MRTKTEICRLLQGCRHILLGPFGLSLVLASPGWLGVPPAAAASEITDDQIVAAIKAQNNDKTPKLGMWDFGDLFSRESAHRTQNSLDLLAILRDPKSGDETRGYAAYYLG